MSTASETLESKSDLDTICANCGCTRKCHLRGSAEVIGPGANTRAKAGYICSLYACLALGGFTEEKLTSQ